MSKSDCITIGFVSIVVLVIFGWLVFITIDGRIETRKEFYVEKVKSIGKCETETECVLSGLIKGQVTKLANPVIFNPVLMNPNRNHPGPTKQTCRNVTWCDVEVGGYIIPIKNQSMEPGDCVLAKASDYVDLFTQRTNLNTRFYSARSVGMTCEQAKTLPRFDIAKYGIIR